MKKVLSLLLCLVMLMSVCSVGINAAYETYQLTKYPVIIVAGFMGSSLYKLDEETGEENWAGEDLDPLEEMQLRLEYAIQKGGYGVEEEEIESALKEAGFSKVKVDHHKNKPWITVLAKKG